MKVSESVIQSYNSTASGYDSKWTDYLRESLKWPLEETIKWLNENCKEGGGTIYLLDIGCGTGEFISNLLLQLEASSLMVERLQIIGLEPAVQMLSIARSKCDSLVNQSKRGFQAIQWINASALEIPLESDTISLIISTNMLHFVGDRTDIEQACREMGRVLKKNLNSRLLMTDWCYDYLTIVAICKVASLMGYKSSDALTKGQIEMIITKTEGLKVCHSLESFRISTVWALWFGVWGNQSDV